MHPVPRRRSTSTLSAPKPHEVPFGVAGSAQLIKRIEHQAGTALKIKTYETEADMRDAIDQQDIFGAISFTYVPVAFIAALAVFTASTITQVALKAFGSKAVPFVLLVVLILGSPSSGGAVAPELLPAFFRFIHQWLPTGAATSALRNNVYFAGAQHGRPLFVLAAWLLIALVGLYLVSRRRRPTAHAR